MIKRYLGLTFLLVFLLNSNVLAFKNEPLGWSGWPWGTQYYSVSKELNKTTSIGGYDLYLRPRDPAKPLLNIWLAQYAFINGQFAGIIIAPFGRESSYQLRSYLPDIYGEPTGGSVTRTTERSDVWFGEYSRIILYQYLYDDYTSIIILGTPEYVSTMGRVFSFPGW